MTSSVRLFEQHQILIFQVCVGLVGPKSADAADLPKKTRNYLALAVVIIGVFSVFLYKKFNLTIAASFAILSGAILFLGRWYFADRTDARDLNQFFSIFFAALHTETYYKQQSFLHVFKQMPATLEESQKVLQCYERYYDTGEGLDALCFLEDSIPTISMQNYRQLKAIAQCFLKINVEHIFIKDVPSEFKANIKELRNRCARLVHGQDFQQNGTYNPHYVQLVQNKTVFVVQPWVVLDVPSPV